MPRLFRIMARGSWKVVEIEYTAAKRKEWDETFDNIDDAKDEVRKRTQRKAKDVEAMAEFDD